MRQSTEVDSLKKWRSNMDWTGAKERAYDLMVMLGTIVDEFNRGECVVSKRELEEMYGYASELNQYFEEG